MLMKKDELLTPEIVAHIRAHALAEYPNECVGIITPDGYKALDNLSTQPTLTAKWPKDIVATHLAAKTLLAMVHSHPDGGNCPSGADMASQLRYRVPWVIVATNGEATLTPFAFGDEVERPDLWKRGFQHGVTDCYAFIRDWYAVNRETRLPEFARDWAWWRNGDNLYMDGFNAACFSETTSPPETGDVFLYAIGSETVNHAAIYVGDNLIAHHAATRSPFDPSKRPVTEPMGRWQKHLKVHLRHNNV